MATVEELQARIAELEEKLEELAETWDDGWDTGCAYATGCDHGDPFMGMYGKAANPHRQN